MLRTPLEFTEHEQHVVTALQLLMAGMDDATMRALIYNAFPDSEMIILLAQPSRQVADWFRQNDQALERIYHYATHHDPREAIKHLREIYSLAGDSRVRNRGMARLVGITV